MRVPHVNPLHRPQLRLEREHGYRVRPGLLDSDAGFDFREDEVVQRREFAGDEELLRCGRYGSPTRGQPFLAPLTQPGGGGGVAPYPACGAVAALAPAGGELR